MKELLAQLVATNRKAEERQAQMAEQLAEQKREAAEQKREAAEEKLAADQRHRDEMAQLIQQIQRPPVQQIEYRPVAPGAAEIRAEKVQKINFNIRKSNRLKPFRVSGDSDVKGIFKEV